MRLFCCFCFLVATLSGAHAVDLLDPVGLVNELSQEIAGTEKWKRPEFCG
jgi:hypothetical protein